MLTDTVWTFEITVFNESNKSILVPFYKSGFFNRCDLLL